MCYIKWTQFSSITCLSILYIIEFMISIMRFKVLQVPIERMIFPGIYIYKCMYIIRSELVVVIVEWALQFYHN